MGDLGTLTTEQIDAIAAALGGDTTPPPSPPPPSGTDGVALYTQNCADCHRDLASSEVTGKPAGKIQDAIDDNKGGMGALDTLTTEQIEAIAVALAEVGDGGDDD
jgi:mono/diheme cytochrome c family protein